MAGMIQILTWLLCFYLVIKGFEIYMIAAASSSDSRKALVGYAKIIVFICIIFAVFIFVMQEQQAITIGRK